MANQSSAEGEPSFLDIDVPSKNDKARWVQAAQRAKLTLPQWVIARLNQAAQTEVPAWNQSPSQNDRK